jgi:hypothetical protein
MLRSAAIARIKRGLGFRDDLDNEIISALQEAQRLLETGRTLPDFLKVENEALLVPMGDSEVALPSGFLREVDDEGLHFVGSTPDAISFIPKDRYDTLAQSFVNVSPGAPRAYKLMKGSILFFPYSRDQDYTLYWSYYKRSMSLAAETGDNEWLNEETGAPEALIGKAGLIIAMDIRDADAAVIFQKMHTEGWSGAFAATIERNLAQKPLRMGSRL